MEGKRLTPGQAKLHLQQYCSYQERSHFEVKEKLFSFGLRAAEVEDILSELISEDFLNEERFARAYARGKFRMKSWGRIKIRYHLKQKGVSDYCIKKGLTEIDEDDYLQTLNRLHEEKWNSLRGEKNTFTKKKKAADYLRQKGYEWDLISELLKKQ